MDPTIPGMILLSECRPRWLYFIDSRNLTLGVYDEQQKGFIGIRTKFRARFLDTEYHWDTGAPFGTAKPYVALEPLPDDIDLDTSSEKLRVWLDEAEFRLADSVTEYENKRRAGGFDGS